MKIWICVDNGDEEVSAHAERSDAEAEAVKRGGRGGTWANAPSYGYRKYSGSRRSVRVVERVVEGDPLGM
jgi:hypothetical protein